MVALLLILASVVSAVLSVSFLPYLPVPLSEVFLPVIAVSYAVFTGRTVAAAAFALVSGLVLDLHGLYPFGAEMAALLGTVALLELAFRRVITNTTFLAAFLLGAVAYVSHLAVLFLIDGVAVLFGESPLVLSVETPAVASWTRGLAINAALTVLLLWGVRAVKRRFERNFILSS